MNTLDIPQTKVHLEYPSCMNELTPEQFDTYCRLFLDLKEERITLPDFYVRVAIELLDIDLDGNSYNRMRKREKEAVQDNLRQVIETLTWLLVEREENGTADNESNRNRENKKDNENKRNRTNRTDKAGPTTLIEPNIEFARNLVPALGNNIGPADALQNITLAEFRDAIGHSMNFSLTKDEEYLSRLCASLYRPENPRWPTLSKLPDWNGDKRFVYNSAYAENNFHRFDRFPLHQRFGVYLMFNAALGFLKTGTVTIEGKEISFSILWEETGKQQKKQNPQTKETRQASETDQTNPDDHPGIGMAGVLFSLAETGVFGTLKDVEKVNLYVALARLYQVKINEPKLDIPKREKGQDKE